MHLSYPPGSSVNDGIDIRYFRLRYSTVSDAIDSVMRLGQGALMAKIDIKSAFRLCPVHPADHHLLGMKFIDMAGKSDVSGENLNEPHPSFKGSGQDNEDRVRSESPDGSLANKDPPAGEEPVGDEIPEEIVAGILKRICQLQIQKGKRDLAGAKWAFPRVSFREKWILLPDTLRKADNYGLMIIIYLARKLDLELREIPYEGKKIRDLTTEQEKFCIGL